MRKKSIEIVGAILLIVLLAVLLFWLFAGKDKASKPIPEEQDTTQNIAQESKIQNVPVVFSPNPVARTFVERFGSFSSESGYKNVEDVANISTDDLRTRLLAIANNARQELSSAYYGVSTRVISMDANIENEESVVIDVKTQREESIDSPNNTVVRYQNIKVNLVKNGEQWLVDDFTWE